jgi:hypothetical protein
MSPFTVLRLSAVVAKIGPSSTCNGHNNRTFFPAARYL